MKTTDFTFELPAELIAQEPLPERSASRLMAVEANTGGCSHLTFRDLPQLLTPDDLLVFNNTRVIPARLFAQKQTGGRVEILIERMRGDGSALAHVRASKSPRDGALLLVTPDPESDISDMAVRVVGREGALFVLMPEAGTLKDMMRRYGHMPLPPYIERDDSSDDFERYQTVYAEQAGAVAAPTAGLHFDESILAQLAAKGVSSAYVTLHVGAGTFQPLRVDDVRDHVMHKEWLEVSPAVCEQIHATVARGGRIIAVGTTAVRCLETAAASGTLQAYRGDTQLFITPGYRFNVVDAMVTNFHLPESTLIMLVAAFAGKDHVMQAYNAAIEQQYRFFSYGDAMFIQGQHASTLRQPYV